MALRIGELAERTGASAPTIRYYEEIGLLPRPQRRRGGQRCYDAEDIRRLTFIRRCRDFALPIKQVQILVSLMQDRGGSCAQARDLAQRHLTVLRAKRAELGKLERTIAGLVQDCDAARANAPGQNCAAWRDANDANATRHAERTSGRR
jgi:DNA-binding transcriptional MerR regulator